MVLKVSISFLPKLNPVLKPRLKYFQPFAAPINNWFKPPSPL